MKEMLLLILLLLLLVACEAESAPRPLPASAIIAASAGATDLALQSEEPIVAEAAARPIHLAAPALNLNLPIEEMGWQVTEVEGERKATWEVPQDSAGWHINSARPGTAGNMVLSGHHLLGTAVFAPIARGEMTAGTELIVTDEQGRAFLYRVSKVSEPIPALGALAADQEEATAYLASSTKATLTLITGWPDFSDTHYLFVVADFAGVVQFGAVQ